MSCFCKILDFILVSVRHNPVTFLDQSESRSTSHLMNRRPIAEVEIFWCLLSFTTWVSCYYWWSSLLKSPQSSLKYNFFTSYSNTGSALILDPTLWSNWPLIDISRGDNGTSELDIESFWTINCIRSRIWQSHSNIWL